MLRISTIAAGVVFSTLATANVVAMLGGLPALAQRS
jgi:hypothetical protein